MGSKWYLDIDWPQAGDVLHAQDGSSFVVSMANRALSVYTVGSEGHRPATTFPPPELEKRNGGLVRVTRAGRVVWSTE